MDDGTQSLLTAMLNMTAAHREHEKFYAVSPREQAVALQRHSRTLQALADQWTLAQPRETRALSPYEGADDLNSLVATQLDGVLFMEGEGEPGEISALKRELRAIGADSTAAGDWLSSAMESAWAFVPQLFAVDQLADVFGERHRIIANDWQGSSVLMLVGHLLARAADLLDHVEFSPPALRARLRDGRPVVGYLYSSAEIIDRAADLLCDFAGLVHDNERRWRVFRARVASLVGDTALERAD